MWQVHYRLIEMPKEEIPPGSNINIQVVEVNYLENNDIEVVARYLGHEEA